MSLAAFAGTVSAQCWLGSWEAPFDDNGAGMTPAPAGNPPVGWPANFNFDAIHASLIPKGCHQGHVMVFDAVPYTGHPSSEDRIIRYAIVDPVNKVVWRHIYVLQPPRKGDLFCAGHAWTKDGNLFLAGGTGCHGQVPSPCQGGWEGAKLTYVWQPPLVTDVVGHGGYWYAGPDLQEPRWYPSVIALQSVGQEDPMLVPGGTHNGADVNSYQVWRDTNQPTPGGQWRSISGVVQWSGPTGVQVDSMLGDYPRMHLLSNEYAATAGMRIGTDRVNHFVSPIGWTNDANWKLLHPRYYGSSVLFPISPGGVNKDHILSIGGLDYVTNTITLTVEMSLASATSPANHWLQGAVGDLAHRRWLFNSVLLANGDPLVVGGEKMALQTHRACDPAFVPELLDQNTLSWMPLAAGTIIRDYHSTALLLPSGKVLTGGGEKRRSKMVPPPAPPCSTVPITGAADYQVFVPPYLNCGSLQPTILTPPVPGGGIVWPRGTTQTIQYSVLEGSMLSIAKVTLLRAGSVTHHCDPNQRCLQLEFTVVPDANPPALQITVPAATPPNVGLLPRGYYMLFLITNEGTPSEARWIQVT